MAELIFLHIENINRGIENESINFSANFSVSFHEQLLSIENKKNLPLRFWSKKVSNISLLAGKNGVGKTSILDIIGFNEKTRVKNYPRARYFLIYHVYEDLFYFEGTISNKISNIKNSPNKKNNFFFKCQKNILTFHEINYSKFFDIYYQRILTNIPWATEKVIYKDKHKYVNKFSDVKLMPKDIIDFLAHTNLFERNNPSLKISQKKSYSNTPIHLFGLYKLTNSDLNNVVNFNNFSKSILNKANPYKRSTQDNLYDAKEYWQEYFIVRLLEKKFLDLIRLVTKKNIRRNNNLQFFSWDDESYNISNNEDLQDQLIKSFIRLREKKYDSLNQTKNLSDKVNFLLDVIKNFQLNLVRNYQMRDDIDFNELVKQLYSLPNIYFSSKNDIELDLKFNNTNQYNEFFSDVFENYSSQFIFKFSNFSDGELVYLNVFSNVHKILLNSTDKDLLLLLDEPDLNLHPEWSRTFIYKLIELVNLYKTSGSVQIIITSHSPFMVTDFPKQNIYTVQINEKAKINISPANFGFAANLYDVISDTFFMDYPIGEFAKSKISMKETSNVEKDDYKKVINLIDDNFLKNSLKNQLQVNIHLGENNDKNK